MVVKSTHSSLYKKKYNVKLFFSIQPGKKRKGYIGHLATIAKSLHNTEAFYSDHFRGIIVNTLDSDTVSRWDSFTSTTLEDNEERMSTCLVSYDLIYLCNI